MITRSTFKRVAVMLLVIAMPIFTFAKANGGGSSVTIETPNGYASATLTVTGPDDDTFTRTFRGGQPVVFNLSDMPGEAVADGHYSYSVTFAPNMSNAVKQQLAAARAAGDDKAAAKVLKANGVTLHAAVTGSFLVLNGGIVDTGSTEADANDARLETTTNATTTATGSTLSGPGGRFQVETQAQVIPDDLIVQGSECVGIDCTATESFGFDTIRLKENNLRIKAEDTSTASGFPTTDWQLTFNDSNSGGLNKFSVDDVTNVKTPFTIEANTPNNTLYVDSTGRIGIQQSSPVLDIHVTTGNTPALRLEQTNASGFTAQTWDMAGNEANFFVRDVTGGSLLPFRIRPGAPTSSIDIAASGRVGMGTASPQANLDIRVASGSQAHVIAGSMNVDFLGAPQTGYGASNGTEQLLFVVQTGLGALGTISNTNLGFITNNSTKMTITAAGNVGIGNAAPGSQLVITNGASSSSINAGASQFTVSSSRTFKDNIEPMEVPDILTKIQSVPVVTYDFKSEGPKDVMGLIAEDFHKVFERGDEQYINGHEVQMALWMAVQQLTAQNKALTERLSTLEKQLTEEQQQ